LSLNTKIALLECHMARTGDAASHHDTPETRLEFIFSAMNLPEISRVLEIKYRIIKNIIKYDVASFIPRALDCMGVKRSEEFHDIWVSVFRAARFNNRSFGYYVDELLSKEYNAFPICTQIELAKSIAINFESRWAGDDGFGPFKNNDADVTEKLWGHQGVLNLPDELTPKIIKDAAPMVRSAFNSEEEMSTWLRYSAAHLMGLSFTPKQASQLTSLYAALARHPDDRVRYGCSQVLGQALQAPETTEQLLTSLEACEDKTLGVLLHKLHIENGPVSSQLVLLLNDPSMQGTPQATALASKFVDFVGCTLIDNAIKNKLLSIVVDAASNSAQPAEKCVALLNDLGAIGKYAYNYNIHKIYPFFLLHCDNEAQIYQAANIGERACFIGMLEVAVINKWGIGYEMTHSEEYGELRSYNEKFNNVISGNMVGSTSKIDLTNSEKLHLLQVGINAYAKSDDVFTLIDKSEQARDDLFGSSTHSPAVNLFQIQEVSDKFPQLTAVHAHAVASNNQHLFTWCHTAILLMLDTAASTRESGCAQEMLKAQADFHGGKTLVPALACLYLSLRKPDIAPVFEAFAQDFKRPHTKVFAAPLFVLSGEGAHAPELTGLTTMLQHKRFKDTKKALPMLGFVTDMALVKSVAKPLIARIVGLLAHEAKDVKSGMTVHMACIAGLCKLADAKAPESAAAKSALEGIVQAQDIGPVCKELIQTLLGAGDDYIDAYMDNLERYLSTSRLPVGLLTYAISMFTGLEGEERSKVMAEVALLAQGLAANDGGATLKAIRYDTLNNPHNARLAAQAPRAWRVWQQDVRLEHALEYRPQDLDNPVDTLAYLKQRIVVDCHVDAAAFPLLVRVLNGSLSTQAALAQVPGHKDSPHPAIETPLLLALTPGASKLQVAEHLDALPAALPSVQFTQDIKDLKKQLRAPPQSLEKCEAMRAGISSQAEDLFLSGTEVLGSCQTIHGHPHLNKALPSYVLDGKYLLAQIVNPNGSLICRRMLRLTWSDKYQKPVIFVERQYSNPGVPQKIKDAMMAMVDQKAQAMGALVATLDSALASGEVIEALHVGPSSRAYEYVDALALTDAGPMQEGGDYVIADAYLVKHREPTSVLG
jgi:hypothetical protein